MPNDKVTIEISREDAKWMEILLGNTNDYDLAATLSHAPECYSPNQMSDACNAMRRTYYQLRIALEGRIPNP